MNYDKLWSLINKAGLTKSGAAKIAEMSHTGFVYMMERQTMTVDALEKFAAHFNLPISNFFDPDNTKEYPPDNKVQMLEDTGSCSRCLEKDAEIKKLNKDLLETKDKYIHLLETGSIKKESPPTSGKKTA